MGLFDRFRKDTVKDPFGGGGDEDDFYEDEESRFTDKGPKIALLASGLVFAGVVGFISYVLLTSDAQPVAAPVSGNFADLEIVDESAPAAASEQAPVQDATAATDRSAERRPWLTTSSNAPATPPAAKPAVTPPANTAAVTPPVNTAKPAAPTPPPAAKPIVPTAKSDPAAAPATPHEDTPNLIAGIPALDAPGVAPGAPERFAAAGDAGPAVAGGRPRLVDPPLPPTDRVAVSAPPPRFAALRDMKKASTANAPASAAKVAIVVRGLGLNQSATEAAITKLPAAVTLAFSPYARNLKTWMDRAKAQGHEVLIEVPLESKDFPAQDPGPLGLLTTLELKESTERLDAVLKAGAGAAGVFDAYGTKFREDAQSITPVFAKLKEQNLFYVQGSPGARMGDASIPTAVADVVVDERPFRAAVDARLDYVERLARYQGSVVAAMQAKPVSFERLALWLDQARKKGVVLTPVSSVLIEVPAAPAAASAPAATAKTKPAEAQPTAKAKPVPAAARAKAKPAH